MIPDYKRQILDLDSEVFKNIMQSLRCRCDIVELNKWKIAVLKSNLQAAIEKEDYLKADEIKKEIECLKNAD